MIRTISNWLTLRNAFVYHLLLASSFFSPFLFLGESYIGSTDLFHLNYPTLLMAKRNFLAGTLGNWNPYLLSGGPLSASAIMPILSPENWPLFLVPESLFFTAVTLWAFLKLVLLGFIAFRFFTLETGSALAALLVSTSLQLSGYVGWSLTTESTSLPLYTLICLYLVRTHRNRSRRRNHLYKTLAMVGLLTCTNLLYELYALIAIAFYVIFINRTDSSTKSAIQSLGLAFVVACLITSVRWLPSGIELFSSNRVAIPVQPSFKSLAFLVTRLFVPETFGVGYWTSANVIQSLNTDFTGSGIHIHSHFSQYFGIVAILWVVGTAKINRSIGYWGLLTMVLILISLGVEPFYSLTQWFLRPLFHRPALKWVIAFCFSMTFAHCLRARPPEQMSEADLVGFRKRVWIAFWIALLLSLVISIQTVQFYFSPSGLTKLLIPALIVLWLIGKKLSQSHRLAIALWILTVVYSGWAIETFWRSAAFMRTEVVWLAASVCLLSSIFLFCRIRTPVAQVTLYLVTAFFLVVLWFPFHRQSFLLPPLPLVGCLAGFGVVRFLVVTTAIATIPRQSWIFLLALMLGDQIAAFKLHGDVVMNPFHSNGPIYPPKDFKWDIQNYRVNFPNRAAASPLYERLFSGQEVLSSAFLVYGIRSYGGYVNSSSASYAELLEALVGTENLHSRNKLANGYIADFSEPRALDLLGVKYDLVNEQWITRPNALSRFMLFSRFELWPDKSLRLNRLTDKSWNPLSSVLLEENPGIPQGPPISVAVTATEDRQDKVVIDVKTESPSTLLFNDSFHRGWTARINGILTPVLRANANFMAIALPAGVHQVRWQFVPPGLLLSWWLLGLGILGLIAPCLIPRRLVK